MLRYRAQVGAEMRSLRAFLTDERAVAPVVGFVLLFGIGVIAFSGSKPFKSHSKTPRLNSNTIKTSKTTSSWSVTRSHERANKTNPNSRASDWGHSIASGL